MSEDTADPGVVEPVLDRIAGVVGAETLDEALAQAARLFASLTRSFATVVFAVDGGRVVADAWAPDDEARRGRLRPHLRRLALDSLERRAPVETAFPPHVTTGLVPHVLPLVAGERMVGALCCACLPSPDSEGFARDPRIDVLARIVAHKIAALFEASVARGAGERYERWFRQLDSQIRVLDRERQKFAALVNQTDTFVFVADAGGTISWANRAMGVSFPPGGPDRTWVGRPCGQACARLGAEGCAGAGAGCSVVRAAEGNRAAHAEFRRVGPAGTRSLYATAYPIKGVEGRTQEVIVMVQDISDLETLKRSEMRYRLLFERAPNAIVMVDPGTHRIVHANPVAIRMLDLPHEMPGERTLATLFVPDSWRELRERLGGLDGEEAQEVSDLRLCDGRGEERTVNLSAGRFDLAGQPVIMIELYDITERRRVERALRAAEERVRTVISNSPIVLFSVDRDGVFTLSEGRGLSALGLRPGEVVGRRVDELYRDTPEILASIRRALNGEEHSATVEVGSLAFDTRYAPVRDTTGMVTGVIGVATDVTELRALEERLRQTGKMEALGRLAGGVAHDFNNLLTVIIGRTQLLLGQLGPEHAARRSVEEVHKAGVCATLITRQLLAFSHRDMVRPQVLDLCAVVKEMDLVLTRLVGEGVALITRLDPGQCWVRADRNQMEQVILNLAMNARDAMPSGGSLEIRVERSQSRPQPAQSADAKPVDRVTLTVADTGCGMDPEARSRVFEPFFTTKSRDQVTGRGLSLVHGIVQASAGEIELESEPGRGTVVRIHLPAEKSAERGVSGVTVAPGPVGNEIILLVEDEPGVRRLAREVLILAGYTVIEAPHGIEALKVANRHPGEIDLLITDVVMPLMGGGELARQLQTTRPGLRVLCVSGYTDDAMVRNGVLIEGAALIQKPFTPEDLARKVRETLDAPAPGEARAAA